MAHENMAVEDFLKGANSEVVLFELLLRYEGGCGTVSERQPWAVDNATIRKTKGPRVYIMYYTPKQGRMGWAGLCEEIEL